MHKFVLFAILLSLGLVYCQEKFTSCKAGLDACNKTGFGNDCVCVSLSSSAGTPLCACLDCTPGLNLCPVTEKCVKPSCSIAYDEKQNAFCNVTSCGESPTNPPISNAPESICCKDAKPECDFPYCEASATSCVWKCRQACSTCRETTDSQGNTCSAVVAGALCNYTSCEWACNSPVNCECSDKDKPTTCDSPSCDPSNCKWACPTSNIPERCIGQCSDNQPRGCKASCIGVTSLDGSCINAKWVPVGCSQESPSNCTNPMCQIGSNSCSWTCTTCTGSAPCPRATCVNGMWNTAPCKLCTVLCSNNGTRPYLAPDATCLSYNSECVPSSIDPTTGFILSCDWKPYCLTPANTSACDNSDCANQVSACPDVATGTSCVRDSTGRCTLKYTCPLSNGTVNCDGKCPPISEAPTCPTNFEVSTSACVPQMRINAAGTSDLVCGWKTGCVPSKVCIASDCNTCVAVAPELSSGMVDYDKLYNNCSAIDATLARCYLMAQRTCTMTPNGCAWVSTSSCTPTTPTTPPPAVCVGSDPCTCKYSSKCVFLQAQMSTAVSKNGLMFATCLAADDQTAYELKIKNAGFDLYAFATSAPANCTPSSNTGSDQNAIEKLRQSSGGDNTASATSTLASDISSAVAKNKSSAFGRFTLVIVLTFQPTTSAGVTTMSVWVDFISATGETPSSADLSEFCPILQKFIKNSAGSAGIKVVGDCSWVARTTKRQASETSSYQMSSAIESDGTAAPAPGPSTSGVSAIFGSALLFLALVLWI